MSNYREFEDNKNLSNEQKNIEDRKKYWLKWRRTKRFLGFFYSSERYLLKEIIVNWFLFFSPIIVFLVVAFVPDSLGLDLVKKSFTGTEKNLAVVAGIGIGVFIMITILIICGILKSIWGAKRKKGIYWPEDKNIGLDKAKKKEG